MTDFRPFWEQRDPDFINELGIKWWLDKDTTSYAMKPDRHGTSLDVNIWVAKFPDDHITRLMINSSYEVIEDEQSLEAMAVKIDVRKFLKNEDLKTQRELDKILELLKDPDITKEEAHKLHDERRKLQKILEK